MRISKQVMDYLESYFLPRTKNSTLGGNITPNATESHNLGSPAKRWDTIYAKNVVADSLTGAGGSADMVDGFHAYSTPTASSLLALDANSRYPVSTYYSALLVDGSRTLTGNLAVDPSITIDGVDISAHAGNATIHHLSGMSQDDHSIYVHTTISRTISAVHTFSPGTPQAPFVLDTNAQSQLVTGLRADELNKQVIAGTGLSGGGTLTANRTLNIDFSGGSPSSIEPDDVSSVGAANYAARADHQHAIVAAAPSTNLSATTANTEGSGSSFSRADHVHAITASHDPGVATSILKTNTSGELFITGDFGVDTDTLYVDVSEDSIYINPGTIPPTYRGALYAKSATTTQKTVVFQKIASQSDLAPIWSVVDETGQNLIVLSNQGDLSSGDPGFVSGLTGWQITATGNAEFWNATIRGELHASVFVADEMHATGGTFVVMTPGIVDEPKSVNDNVLPLIDSSFTLVVQSSWDTSLCYFADKDVIRLKFMGTPGLGLDLYDVYLEVSGTPSSNGDRNINAGIPGTFDVPVIRRSGGATGLEIPAGTGAVKWGKSDETLADGSYTGGILLTSDLSQSPYIDVFTINADGSPQPWEASAIKPRVRLGNLDGIGTLAEQWGIAFGTDLSDNTKPYGVFSDLQASLVGITQTWWDSSQNAVAQIDPTAIGTESLFWLGPSASNKKLDYLASGILALKSGVYMGNAPSNTQLLNGGLLWLPFDSPAGSTNYSIDTRNLIDWSEPTTEGASVISGHQGKYHKGAVLAEDRTNYIENPVFNANITDGWGAASGTGTVSWDSGTNYVLGGSMKIVAGTTSTFITTDYPAGANTGLAVTNGSTVFLQARVRMSSASGAASITIRDITTPASVATASSPAVADTWSLVVASWTNNTGVTKYVQARLVNSTNDSSTIAYFDSVQLELTRITPLFYGGMNSDYTWSGTSHNSTSVRGNDGYLKYPLAWDTSWTISCWVYPYLLPEETNEYTRVFEWAYDTSNRVYVYYDYVNDVVRANWTGDSTQTATTVSSVSLTRGVSTHIALTYDGTTLSLYIDGALIDAKTGMTAFSTNPDYMFVGCNVAVAGFLNGIIDDFVVIDTCVPAETITKIEASPSPIIVVNDTELHMFTTGDGRIRINPDGLFLSDSLGRGVFGAASSPPGSTWGGFTLAEGDLVIGDNNLGRASVFWDNSAGILGFYGGGSTMQAYIDTDGAITAASGHVKLNELGVVIDNSTITDYRFIIKDLSDTVFKITAVDDGTFGSWSRIDNGMDATSKRAYTEFRTWASTGYRATYEQRLISGSANSVLDHMLESDQRGGIGILSLENTDLHVWPGLMVGNSAYAWGDSFPLTGDIWAYNHLRVGGGIYAGATTTSAATGEIIATGVLRVNDTADGNLTKGLSLNQGTADNNIISLKSSDVAHGMTTDMETDTFGNIGKSGATAGGIQIDGWSSSTNGMRLTGAITTETTTKATGSAAAILIQSRLKSGTTYGDLSTANANILAIRNNGTTRFIFDIEGDLHSDSSNTTFDSYDDAQLVRALEVERGGDSIIRTEFDNWLKYNRADLENAKLATFNEDGHVFVNWMSLSRLHSGAIWQLATRLEKQESIIRNMERALLDAGINPNLYLEQ